MAVFTIETPDGRKLDIEADDENGAIAGAQEWVASNPAPPETWGEYGMGLLQKVGQGATFGFGDEIAAGAGAVGNQAMRALGVDVPERGYGEILDEVRGDESQFAARNPKTAIAAEIGGGLTSLAAGPARAIAAAPGWMARVGRSAKVGAGYGAASGFGNSEGGVGERAAGTAAGAGIGAVAGPLIADVALPVATTMARAIPQTAQFAQKALQSARNPEAAAFRNVADKGVQSGVDFNALRARVSPETSAQLQTRGFTEDDIASIVSRQINGEDAATVAADYAHLVDAKGNKFSAGTARNYLKKYEDANPTPLNVTDLTKDVAGQGGAEPMTRYARAAHSIAGSEDNTAARALVGRQEMQPGRVASIIEKRMGGGDFAAKKTANAENLQKESKKAYDAFYKEPELATNQLADLMEEPLFQSAIRNAQRQERLDIIKQNQALQKAGKPLLPVPSIDAEAQVFSPQMLDLVQRDLRLTAEGFANPNEANYARNMREVFLDRIEQHYPTFRGLRTTYASGKMEQDAFDAGVKLTTKLGAPTREALAGYETMTPAQQAIFRDSFGTALQDKAAGTVRGAQAANQFTSDSFEQIIGKLYPKSNKTLHDEGQKLLRELRMEATTTRTKNDVLSGSRTAELAGDMDKAGTMGEAAASAATGNYLGVFRALGKRMSQQIGSEGARQSLKILTETDPAKLLPILTRLAKNAKTSKARQESLELARALRSRSFADTAPAASNVAAEQFGASGR
jgi:hypothetical protein